MKRGTPDHPKTKRLARRLGLSRPAAVGTLEMLWHFTARYAPMGSVAIHAPEDIADAVDWDGDPSELIEALVECGWLDGDWYVHDWHVHCDEATRKSLERREETHFANGTPVRQTKSANGRQRQTKSASPSPSPSPSPSEEQDAAYAAACEAFALYGKTLRSKPSAARRKALKAIVAHSGLESVSRAIHGYRAYHRRASGDFDPDAHFKFETVFRAANREKYIEAYDEAIAAGLSPPFAKETTHGPAQQRTGGSARTPVRDAAQAALQRRGLRPV